MSQQKAEEWVEVKKGRDTYYYNRDTKSSSWILPANAVLAGGADNPGLSSIDGISTLAGDRKKSALTADALSADGEDIAADIWTVRLHPDSGQVYYSSTTTGDSSWESPFHQDRTSEMVSAESRRRDDLERNELEALAGFDLSPDGAVFQSAEAVYARDCLEAWVEGNQLEVSDEDMMRIKWAEYTDVVVEPESTPLVIHVWLESIQARSDLPPYIKVSTLDLSNTVADLLNSTFESIDANSLGINQQKHYFKMRGYAEYILHKDFCLGHYDFISVASRRGMNVDLNLIKLSDADIMDIGQLLDVKLEDERHREREKMTSSLDLFTTHTSPAPITSATRWQDMKYVPLDDIKWPLRVIVGFLRDCPQELPCSTVQVEMTLMNNGAALSEPARTKPVPLEKNLHWREEWTMLSATYASNLPISTRIRILLIGRKKDGSRLVIAGAAIPVLDFRGHLVQGKQSIRLWPHEDVQCARDPKLGKGENLPKNLRLDSGPMAIDPSGNSGFLQIEFDSYALPVVGVQPTLTEVSRESAGSDADRTGGIPREIDAKLSEIANADPLVELSDEQKVILFQYKNQCIGNPSLLPKFLMSVDWSVPAHVVEARRLLFRWAPVETGNEVDMLQLMLGRYSDPIVREYAVRELNKMSDNVLKEYLLQLVQTLKYEPYHDSPLLRMILRRALKNPNKIGHTLFWLLRSEMHVSDVCERFGIALEVYLKFCGTHQTFLFRESKVNSMIQAVAERTTKQPKKKQNAYARAELAKLNSVLPATFTVCLSPRMECKAIIPEKCRVMTSKKLPLWLTLENADPHGDPFVLLFKTGDDLRQDLMTLQMLRIMDQLWLSNGLDLQMLPYGCCATGHDLGMIEVVKNSNTTANIQVEYGGGAVGAFKTFPIDRFLRRYNREAEEYALARERFMYSCAGYCVATFVLGIGDRHADNIMVTESGRLFHIDFGHFLGNFKSKFGINRERAPFVFTPEMAFVLGRQGVESRPDLYPRFQSECSNAYNLLRKKTSMLISLFLLMVPAGMPELLEDSDIGYLQTMLAPDLSEEAAATKFQSEISNALRTTSRQIDNYFHNLKQGA